VKIKSAIEKTMNVLFLICGLLTVAVVLGITLYVIISGLPAIREIGLWDFLLGKVWDSTATTREPQFGILPFILTSIYGTFGAILIGVPIGLMTAVFLAKFASRKVAEAVGTAVELLAGIPSVVYGLLGLTILAPLVMRFFELRTGSTLLTAIIVLSVMVLPSIISVSRTALLAVPSEYEEASYALGATKIETIFKVSLPAAKSGIAASIVLGVGRAIGEAMAVMMVAGNIARMPELLKSVRFLTTAISMEMSYAAGLQRQALLSIALVLFAFIMVINIILGLVLKRGKN